MKKLYLLLPILFLIYWGCEDDKEEESFSIVGTWKTWGRSSGQTDWGSSSSTYTFNSDSTYIYGYDGGSSNGTYFFCETSNVIQWNVVSYTGDFNCNCINLLPGFSSMITNQVTIEGTDTFYISECNDSFQWMKLVKQ